MLRAIAASLVGLALMVAVSGTATAAPATDRFVLLGVRARLGWRLRRRHRRRGVQPGWHRRHPGRRRDGWHRVGRTRRVGDETDGTRVGDETDGTRVGDETDGTRSAATPTAPGSAEPTRDFNNGGVGRPAPPLLCVGRRGGRLGCSVLLSAAGVVACVRRNAPAPRRRSGGSGCRRARVRQLVVAAASAPTTAPGGSPGRSRVRLVRSSQSSGWFLRCWYFHSAYGRCSR